MNTEVIADSETIQILITGDGYGMPKGQAERLNEKLSFQEIRLVSSEPGAGNDSSIGLINIVERIFLHYNEKGYIRVDPEGEEGVSAEVETPWKEGADVSYFSS